MPSSVVSHTHYDKESAILRIFYTSDMIYDYEGVPEKIYLKMKVARSKGSFLNKHIKGHYAFKKVTAQSHHQNNSTIQE